MLGTRYLVCLGSLAIALATTGCSDGECTGPNCTAVADARPGSPWTIEHSFFIPPGAFAEAQLDMKTGDLVEVEFSVDGEAIEWNIHHHPGGQEQATYHLMGSDASAMYEFTAPTDDFYFAMWENPGPGVVTIDVKLKLASTTELVAWF